MRSVRVVLGESMVDLYALPLGTSISEAMEFRAFVGGSGVNLALGLRFSGTDVRYLGSLSRDPHGERLLDALSARGVDTSFVQRSVRPSPLVFVSVSAEGRRRFVPHREDTAEAELSAAVLRDAPGDPLEAAAWLLLGTDAMLREPLRSATRWLMDHCDARGVACAIDLNARPSRWRHADAESREIREFVRAARVLKASVEDLDAMGLPPSMDTLSLMAPGAACVLTRGAQGAEVLACGERWSVEARRARAVDPTGAGDAFFAGLMSVLEPETLSTRGAWDRALARAVESGAMAVESPGATGAFTFPAMGY